MGVILFNHSDADFAVKAGDRVAQLILEAIVTPRVEVVDELVDTLRGAGGFGSTGVAALTGTPAASAPEGAAVAGTPTEKKARVA